MHRSRIGALFIDHPTPSIEASKQFWAAATGHQPDAEGPGEPPYTSLGYFHGSLLVALQHTGDDTRPRLHLDIDTDNVEAEVRRLEALGATRLKRYGNYWQMTDPGGMVFCVIPPHTSDFDKHATVWE